MKKSLLSALCAALGIFSATAAGEITYSVNESNGLKSKETDWTLTSQDWFRYWKSTDTTKPTVALQTVMPTSGDISPLNYFADGSLGFQSSQNQNNRTLRLSILDNEDYYISSYSFTAIPNKAGVNTINGTEIDVTNGTLITGTGTRNDEYLPIVFVRTSGDANANLKLQNFTVTISPKGQELTETQYLPVTSAYQIVSGGKYVIAAYGHNRPDAYATAHKDLTFMTMDKSGTTPQTKFVNFDNATADNATWTAILNPRTCSHNHDHSVSLTLKQDVSGTDYYCWLHTNSNTTADNATTTNSDAQNALEIRKLTSINSNANASNTYFAINYNYHSDGYYEKALQVNPNTESDTNPKLGLMGFASQSGPSITPNTAYSGNGYCTYMVIYHVIETTTDLLAHANGELHEYAESLGDINASTLRSTGVLSEDEIATLLPNYELTSISDYDADVAAKKQALDQAAATMANPISAIKTKLNGKKVYIRACATGNDSDYGALTMSADGNLKHYTDLSIEGIWEVAFPDETHISLKNLAHNKYASHLASSEESASYTFAFSPASDGSFTFKDDSATGDQIYLNKFPNNEINLFEDGATQAGSHWKFHIWTEAEETALFNTIRNNFNYINSLQRGIHPGNVTLDETELSAVASLAENLTNGDYPSALRISKLEYSFNPLESNRFIKISSNSGHYMNTSLNQQGTEHATAFTSSQDDAIYFYSSDSHLISYTQGVAAKHINRNLSKATTAEQNAQLSANATPVTFTAVSENFTSLVGRFYIQHPGQNGNNNVTALMYVGDNGAFGNGTEANNPNDNTGIDSNREWWTFKVEYVTELPITIHADGKGTGLIPVTVKIADSNADDFQAYIARTDDEGNLVFSKVETGGEIPANTPFVIKKASETTKTVCTMAIVNEPGETATALAMPNQRFIASHLATIAPADDDEKVVYVKSATSTDDNNAENGVVFDKATAGQTIPAGALAFYALKNTTEIPETFTLNLVESNRAATAISEISAENPAAKSAVYDIQGRRLSAPARGINIINGRKVLVK